MTIGQYDGDGMWMCASGTSAAITCSYVATCLRPCPSSTSSYLRCQYSSRCVTWIVESKLWGFGGDVVIHSIVRASHGSSGAFGPRAVLMTFRMNTRMPAARMNAPIDSTRFHVSKPMPGA